MSDSCTLLHRKVVALPRFSSDFQLGALPANGIYFVFEDGEGGHGGDRLVRVGTHDGDDNLGPRLKEHLITANKDRSVFRKHIGRSILRKNNDPYFEVWDIDMTTRLKREAFSYRISGRQAEVESEVSGYITKKMRFAAIPVDGGKAARKGLEKALLSTLAQCTVCSASQSWLGRYHPDRRITQSGLWNVQGLGGEPLSTMDVSNL